jgi:hypothetical protein
MALIFSFVVPSFLLVVFLLIPTFSGVRFFGGSRRSRHRAFFADTSAVAWCVYDLRLSCATCARFLCMEGGGVGRKTVGIE